MGFKIYENYVKPFEYRPEPKPQLPAPQSQNLTNDDAKKAGVQLTGANRRAELEKKLPPTPSGALDQISRLPKPDVNDKAAVKAYKQQRAQIAENAIKNSQPPNFKDYSSLPGGTARFEYGEAVRYYNSQVSDLREIAAEAKRNPETILSPSQAVEKINNLPQPDRTNPDSVREYNNQRAQIAKDALMYAKPPKLEDYRNSGLNGRTASYEYEEALRYYNSAVSDLKEAAGFESLSTLLTPAGEKAATEAAGKFADELNESLASPEDFNNRLASKINDLKLEYGDEAAAKMMAELYKKSPDDLLNQLARADKMPAYDKQNLGKTLGDAYGYLSPEDKKKFAEKIAQTTVGDSFTTNVNFGKGSTLGELLANSSNTQMKTDVVKALMNLAGTIKAKPLGDNGGVDVQALFKSAAMLANSASPKERAAMLANIIETLPKINLPSLIKDNETKDLLSQVFMNSGSELLHLIAPDGAISSQSMRDGLIKFTELTLFSEGKNSQRPKLMEYMVKLTKDVGDAAVQPPISQSEYEAAHGGWSQQDHVEIMSTLMAITWKGAQNQTAAIKADQEQQKQTVQMFTGLAFSFVPGAGKVLGELGGEGAEFLEQAAGKIRDFAWDKAKSAAESGVNTQIDKLLQGDSLSNIDSMMSSLRDTVLALNASLPNGENGELDLRSKFQSAFSFYQLIGQ